MYKNLLIKKLPPFVFIVGALGIGFVHLDAEHLFNLFAKINFINLLLGVALSTIVLALSTTRFSVINSNFGGNESWIYLHRMNVLSLLYSQTALPLLTQIIGRITHGSSQRRSFYASMTILEKTIALFVMVFFAIIPAYLTFNKNIIPEGLFSSLAVMACNIFVILLVSLFFFFDKNERSKLVRPVLKIFNISFLPIFLLSVGIQIGNLAIFTILTLQFIPNVDLLLLLSGFAIVILATSVPISFGGCGLREASAAGMFVLLNLPPEIGVMVGVLYGLTHLFTIFANVIFVIKRKTIKIDGIPEKSKFLGIDFWPSTFLLFLATF